ncbi:MAG: CPBP family intramembrane metalloprotease [Nitrososphaerota archaeon]|nr:CPBP family intramembrane metalloprotease [Nitrososphaerota archaeon]
MQEVTKLLGSTVVVILSMAVWFLLPREYFLPAAFVSTSCMIAGSVANGGYRRLFSLSAGGLSLGVASAILLYALFFAGNLAINRLHPLGIGAASENSIYGLIATPSNPLYLQFGLLAFDSVGYESFFRGVIQARMNGRLGPASPFAAAAADACIHALTFNPLWVVTTFIADSVWGLTYRYGGGLTSSVTSHLLWDVAIFLLFPIR